jgi:hypothetical protein
MANPYGRPRTQVSELKIRIPEHILPEIKRHYPQMFRPGPGTIFRHGALSTYITRLVVQDLNHATPKTTISE